MNLRDTMGCRSAQELLKFQCDGRIAFSLKPPPTAVHTTPTAAAGNPVPARADGGSQCAARCYAELSTAHASFISSFAPCSWLGSEDGVGKNSVAKAALDMPGSGTGSEAEALQAGLDAAVEEMLAELDSEF